MTDVETHRYTLTFRCVNCGRIEPFANYPSEGVVREDEIRARIYEVNCKACGWTGETCGISAVRIDHRWQHRTRWKRQAL